MIEVEVLGLARSPSDSGVLLLLKERASPRVLPLGIGPFEAEAIALQLQGTQVPRPLSHDLLRQMLVILDAQLQRVEVAAVTDNVFYAQLIVEQAGQQQTIDSRPSDAVALALRAQAPIFVADSVLDEAGVEVEETEPASPPADPSQLSVFKEFIDSLDTGDLDEGGPEASPSP
ncbi:MAG: bifunctional nuclease family protein [Chloroflexi bacterium]|nr:bifunctional nuclease family protein [Chloroflexota bacterium]